MKIKINGQEILGQEGETILETAKRYQIKIPTLCHYEKLAPYGGCGVCVVEVAGVNKLVRSCATKITEGMDIVTDSARIKAARKTALELMLSDHVGDCVAPCQKACPAQTDVQGYVGLIANREYGEALKVIKEKIPLPASIGRVCPHPCEKECRRQLVDEPISIAWLKSFAADWDLALENPYLPQIAAETGKKIAVVGSGPAGLTAAYYSRVKGHQVQIFEAMPEAGGMLRYGIPEYRLPKKVLAAEVALIQEMGIKIQTNTRIGADLSFADLRRDFDAVYVGIGAWKSSGMRTKGEELPGVVGGIELLAEIALGKEIKIPKKAAVIGGGNTAMDVCRTLIRLGVEEVDLLYRRTKEEMPAEKVEILEAEEEGVNFRFLVAPLEVIPDAKGRASKIKVQKMVLGEPDASGRRRPIPIEGDHEIIEAEMFVSAIGQKVVTKGFDELDNTDWGTLVTDENNFATNLPGVFAGGDAVNNGPGIAIEAIADALTAVESMDQYLAGKKIKIVKPYWVKRDDLTAEDFAAYEKAKRPEMKHLAPEVRKNNFEEIVKGYTPLQARTEGQRCLECGCLDVKECKLIKQANQQQVEPERLAGEKHCYEYKDDHPFVLRNPDKCILCGLCVRTCDEVMGVTALGLLERGFDSVVKPEFDHPLKATQCISCGQCVYVCPTGALQEKLFLDKPVPVVAKTHEHVCDYCGLGCQQTIETCGEMLVRVLPRGNEEQGILCAKGRYGLDRKITGSCQEEYRQKKATGFENISMSAGSKLLRHYMNKWAEKPDQVAIGVAGNLANEIVADIKIVAQTLGIDNLFTANGGQKEKYDILGQNCSAGTLQDILAADLVLVAGTDLTRDYPVAAAAARQAKQKEAQVVQIGEKTNSVSGWSDLEILDGVDNSPLLSLCKALFQLDDADPAEFEATFSEIEITETVEKIAGALRKSKQGVLVFGISEVTVETVKIIKNIELLTGIKLVVLAKEANSIGLLAQDIDQSLAEIQAKIAEGKIKELLLWDMAVPETLAQKTDLIVQVNSYSAENMESAALIVPLGDKLRSAGSYYDYAGQKQVYGPVLDPQKNVSAYSDIWAILGAGARQDKDFEEKKIPLRSEDIRTELWPMNRDRGYQSSFISNRERLLYEVISC